MYASVSLSDHTSDVQAAQYFEKYVWSSKGGKRPLMQEICLRAFVYKQFLRSCLNDKWTGGR